MKRESATHVLATGRQGNPEFFGPLERLLEGDPEKGSVFLAEYVPGTVYVYRAPDQRGTCSYARCNPCFYVFLDRRPKGEGEAAGWLRGTGLDVLAGRDHGSVVLVGPRRENWSAADVFALSKLQLAVEDGLMDLFGSFACNYAVGLGEGASFVHGFVCRYPETASRFAAAVTVGGQVNPDAFPVKRPVPVLFPVYLAGAGEETVRWYRSLNGAIGRKEGEVRTYVSGKHEACQVMVDEEPGSQAEIIGRAWERLLKRRMRVALEPGRNTWLDSPYHALGERYYPGELGLEETVHEDGTFLPGTSICRWYSYIPEESSGRSGPRVPLIFVIHGNNDDARGFLDQCGFLKLAGEERVALLSASHQHVPEPDAEALEDGQNKVWMFDKMIQWMLDRYPCIDRERIYCTGFSRGGMNTCYQICFNPERFAAAAPLSGLGLVPFLSGGVPLTRKDWKNWWGKRGKPLPRMPILIFMCGRDKFFAERSGLCGRLDVSEEGTGAGAWETLNIFREMSGREPLERGELDFSRFPFWGVPLERERVIKTPDVWFREGRLPEKEGELPQYFAWAPGMEHCLYYGYASLVWEFFRRFRRTEGTGEVI